MASRESKVGRIMIRKSQTTTPQTKYMGVQVRVAQITWRNSLHTYTPHRRENYMRAPNFFSACIPHAIRAIRLVSAASAPPGAAPCAAQVRKALVESLTCARGRGMRGNSIPAGCTIRGADISQGAKRESSELEGQTEADGGKRRRVRTARVQRVRLCGSPRVQLLAWHK